MCLEVLVWCALQHPDSAEDTGGHAALRAAAKSALEDFALSCAGASDGSGAGGGMPAHAWWLLGMSDVLAGAPELVSEPLLRICEAAYGTYEDRVCAGPEGKYARSLRVLKQGLRGSSTHEPLT